MEFVCIDCLLFSSDSPLKVFSEGDQFICYHPPTETLYSTSKVLVIAALRALSIHITNRSHYDRNKRTEINH